MSVCTSGHPMSFLQVSTHTHTHTSGLTWMPSRSLLMHQKLSASMFLKASSWRLDTSKFSTSSSTAERGKNRDYEYWGDDDNNDDEEQKRANCFKVSRPEVMEWKLAIFILCPNCQRRSQPQSAWLKCAVGAAVGTEWRQKEPPSDQFEASI